jgi:hypothetical protein
MGGPISATPVEHPTRELLRVGAGEPMRPELLGAVHRRAGHPLEVRISAVLGRRAVLPAGAR